MTEQNFYDLETLLQKLQSHLGSRYVVMPGHLQDGFHIALYDSGGKMIVEAAAASLKKAAERIIQQKSTSNPPTP